MGGVAMNCDRIKKEHIQPTFKKYINTVLNKIPHKGPDTILGSAGKKPTSGDIDVALDTTFTPLQVCTVLEDMGIAYKLGKGFDQIWTEFPQYDENGPIYKTVQVDLMFGKLEWLKFAYWAPNPEDTKFTAHHRSVLLAAIIRYAKELKLEDGGVQTYVINWGSGIWTKKRYEYINKKGELAEKQIKSDKPIFTKPEEVVDLLSESTGVKWELNDLMQPFEKLWEKAVTVFDNDTLYKIAEYVKPAIEHRGQDYIVPDVIEEILKKD